MTAATAPRHVDPVAAATYFVEQLGFTAFPVWGSKAGRCGCGDPHDGTGRPDYGPDNIGKHPATGRGGFKNATSDVAKIRTFLANPGTPNYGLNAPDGVLAVDVDGAKDLARWEELQALHGPLPITLTTTTAHGRHYFYRWPDSAGPMPRGKLFEYVVRRHDDGYVIGPGSVHPSGVTYDTLRQPSGMPYDIAELPLAWAQAATEKKSRLQLVVGGLPGKGHRHDWLRDTARLFAGTVRDPDALRAAVLVENAKLAEPKSEAEVDKAIGEVLQRFPADPVEVDPETGAAVRATPRRIYAEDIELAMPATAPFPVLPDPIAFGGLAGAAVESLANVTSASSVGMLMTLVAAWGGIFGSRTQYHGDQPSILFAVLIGETGRARKGTTTSAVWSAMTHALASGFVSIPITSARWDGLASGEALVRILNEAKGSDAAKPVYGLIVEEEFERLLRRMRSSEGYQSTLDTYLRQVFDARMIQHITASKTLRVYPPYGVSILGNVTRETLRQNVTPDMARSGFANRFLWCPIEERDVDVSGAAPWRFNDEIARSLIDARAAWTGGQSIELDSDALELLNDYGSHLRGIAGMVGAMGARLHVIAARVALVHAALDRSMTIGRPLVERAIALTEYTRSGLRWSFRNDIGDEDANALYSAILAASSDRDSGGFVDGSDGFVDGLSTRQARAVIGRSSRFLAARDLLLENQLITLHQPSTNRPQSPQTPGGGRPAVMLRAVDPAVFRRFVPRARGGRNEELIHESVIHAPQTPHPSPTNRTQTVHKPNQTPDPEITVESTADVHVRVCHFYADHQLLHVRRDDVFVCPICDPEEIQ
jgi:hypothetical protein